MTNAHEPMDLVLATRNSGKIREIRHLLADLSLHLHDLNEYADLPEAAETGNSFLENALLKARFYAARLHLPVIADDSGLCVDALGGRPGVLSARYAGAGAGDRANNEKLLAEMKDITDRRARFVCVTVCSRPNGRYISAEGFCEGLILTAPHGRLGFGYDPLFFYAPANASFAEMPTESKNRISHRAKSLEILKEKLPAFLAAGE